MCPFVYKLIACNATKRAKERENARLAHWTFCITFDVCSAWNCLYFWTFSLWKFYPEWSSFVGVRQRIQLISIILKRTYFHDTEYWMKLNCFQSNRSSIDFGPLPLIHFLQIGSFRIKIDPFQVKFPHFTFSLDGCLDFKRIWQHFPWYLLLFPFSFGIWPWNAFYTRKQWFPFTFLHWEIVVELSVFRFKFFYCSYLFLSASLSFGMESWQSKWKLCFDALLAMEIES